MSHNSENNHDHNSSHGSAKTYVIGFILSIIFSIIPFVLVQNETFSKLGLVISVLVFALLQLLIQLLCFMHLHQEQRPRLMSQALWFTILCVIIIVGGSMFVMLELKHYMHSM